MKGKNELCVRYPDIAVRERDTSASKTAAKTAWHGFCYNVSRMKNAKQRNGSVLMEYVLVQVLVACLLMLVMNELFYNWATGSFGPTGMQVKYFYQRLLGGLSLPVP